MTTPPDRDAVTFEAAGYGGSCSVCGCVVLRAHEDDHRRYHRRLAAVLEQALDDSERR